MCVQWQGFCSLDCRLPTYHVMVIGTVNIRELYMATCPICLGTETKISTGT